MAFLVDTNVVVYRYDPRFPEKQAAAKELLRRGVASGEARLAHQVVTEFVAATRRPHPPGGPLLDLREALREAEELLSEFRVLYPNEELLRLALRGTAAYALSWYDAHLWAYAEHHGVPLLYSEDFQHDRMYGSVRVRNPFIEVGI